MTGPLAITAIRAPVDGSEHGYVKSSWIEAYRYAPGMSRMPFRTYRMMETGWIEHALGRPDTRVLLAMTGDAIAGWVAFCRRPSADVVHWIQTRYRIGRDGEHLRRRSVMVQLIAAAALKPKIGYTFRGSLPRHTETDEPRVSSDVWISRWLADRVNITAVHQPYREWIR